jgi:hypothetical protein
MNSGLYSIEKDRVGKFQIISVVLFNRVSHPFNDGPHGSWVVRQVQDGPQKHVYIETLSK